MTDWDRDHEHEELCAVLGVDDAEGFHIERYGQTSLFWDSPRRGDGSRFPCIGPGNVYTGCLGAACTALSCWAGKLVPTAQHAPRPPLPIWERPGARCHSCEHTVDTPEGLIDCRMGHFDRPITSACLVRQRIPESVELPCPDYQPATMLRPEVVAYRQAKARRTAARQRQRAS